MATARVKAKPLAPHFGPELLEAVSKVGEATELRFRLLRVKLADGQWHGLTKPVAVRVKWATDYFVAVDSQTTFAGAGDTPEDALRDYLNDWGTRLRSLEEDEAILGPGLVAELKKLRAILGIKLANAT